jgi:hypothetical protein
MCAPNSVALFRMIASGVGSLIKKAILAAAFCCCLAAPVLAQNTPTALQTEAQKKLKALGKDRTAAKTQPTATINP